MKKIMEFLKALVTANSGISSNRFLGIFVFTPVLIIMIFTGIAIDYVIAVISLISALLVTNAIAKFSKNDRNNQEIGG